jgi:hypothetical protein
VLDAPERANSELTFLKNVTTSCLQRLPTVAGGSGDEKIGAEPPASREGVGGAKPPKMGFCSGGTRGAKKWQKMAFLGQKRAKNDDF